MNAAEIKNKLKEHYAFEWGSVFIPEYTHGDLRIDALLVNIRKKWIRGFEIKVSHSDFIQDDKWILYSQFCSSLSFVCPENIIMPEEIKKPFGLLWIVPDRYSTKMVWKRKPQNFQKRNCLSWFWTYTHILELEIMRLDRECQDLKEHMKRSERKGVLGVAL
jgi:hypothetical protein